MAIEFLDDVNVEADLTVKPESGNGLLTINSSDTYGNTTIKMGNDTSPEAVLLSAYSNPGADYFEIKYDSGATGSGEFKVGQTEIDCCLDGSSSPITRVSSTGLQITGGLQLSGTFEDSSGDVGTAGQVLSSTGTGTDWISAGGADTNIANTDLTSNANRTLTLGTYSLSFLDSNAATIAKFNSLGNEVYASTFSVRTNSATTAPTLRLSAGTSSRYVGIKSPDTLALTTNYILPTGYGNAGDVLSVETAGALTQQMKWTGGGADVILSGGGKVEMTTSSDASARALLFGGADGFNDSNWNVIAGPNSPGSSLGTPGTTTFSCDPVSVMNALFRSPKSGDINISGTVKFSAGTNSSTNSFVRVYKVPAAFVTDMENGDDPGTSISCTLVAAIQVDTPSLNVDTRPRNYISINGVSISSGDYVFATYSYRGRLTSTKYFTHNFQLLVG